MKELNNYIDDAIIKYGKGINLREMEESFKNKIIFAALTDVRFDRADIVLDGRFDIVNLVKQVTLNHITSDEMYETILEGFERSIEDYINIIITERG